MGQQQKEKKLHQILIKQQEIYECFNEYFKKLIGNSENPCMKANWTSLFPEGPLQMQNLEVRTLHRGGNQKCYFQNGIAKIS